MELLLLILALVFAFASGMLFGAGLEQIHQRRLAAAIWGQIHQRSIITTPPPHPDTLWGVPSSITQED